MTQRFLCISTGVALEKTPSTSKKKFCIKRFTLSILNPSSLMLTKLQKSLISFNFFEKNSNSHWSIASGLPLSKTWLSAARKYKQAWKDFTPGERVPRIWCLIWFWKSDTDIQALLDLASEVNAMNLVVKLGLLVWKTATSSGRQIKILRQKSKDWSPEG